MERPPAPNHYLIIEYSPNKWAYHTEVNSLILFEIDFSNFLNFVDLVLKLS